MEPGGAQADEERLAILHLHDAFMNAHLLAALMESTPPTDSAEYWSISRRGRLERLWASMMYMVLEAWQCNKATRKAVAAHADTQKLETSRFARRDTTCVMATNASTGTKGVSLCSGTIRRAVNSCWSSVRFCSEPSVPHVERHERCLTDLRSSGHVPRRVVR